MNFQAGQFWVTSFNIVELGLEVKRHEVYFHVTNKKIKINNNHQNIFYLPSNVVDMAQRKNQHRRRPLHPNRHRYRHRIESRIFSN